MSLVSAIPQTIKEIGRAKAQGRAAGGQYGQSIADIGQMVGQIPQRQQQARILRQREEAGALELSAARREQQADAAIQNAMSQALAPDGTVDAAKLTGLLAGTPAASKIPDILKGFNELQRTSYALKTAAVNAQDAENDALGSVAHSASIVDDPETQAGLLLSGIASGVKMGTIDQARGKQLVADLVDDAGNPVPEKVAAAISTLKAGSAQQRQLATTDAQRTAAAASAQALADERTEKTKTAKTRTALENYGRQLGSAATQERYARIYAGIPEELRGYFDAPESFDPKESPARAAGVLMTPEQRETARHNRITEAAAAAVRQETTRHNKAMEQKERAGTKTDEDKQYERDFADYKLWLDQWAEVQKRKAPPTTPDGLPVTDYEGKPVPPEYSAPPNFDEWRRLDKGKRVGVGQPGDVSLPPASPQGAATTTTPGPTASNGKPGGEKTVTMAELSRIAAKRGTTVGVQRERAIREGFAVVK